MPGSASCPARGPYLPRRPQASPLYRVLADHFAALERVHEERFEPSHGPLRPAACRAVGRLLDCGLLEHGFARVRCATCRADFLVAFRCKGRHFCPSCHARRLAEWRLWLDSRLLAPVAHRQPGGIVCVQTFGSVAHLYPHLYVLLTDGAFRRDGTFVPLPEPAVLEETWRRAVLAAFVRRGWLEEDAAAGSGPGLTDLGGCEGGRRGASLRVGAGVGAPAVGSVRAGSAGRRAQGGWRRPGGGRGRLAGRGRLRRGNPTWSGAPGRA